MKIKERKKRVAKLAQNFYTTIKACRIEQQREQVK